MSQSTVSLTGEDAATTVAASPVEEQEQTETQVEGQSQEDADAQAKSSGSTDREYLIFERIKAEVDGNVQEVWIQRKFAVEGENGERTVLNGIVARNRDLALIRAAKMFGQGYRGDLVPVPDSMWTPKPVANVPRETYRVQVG